MSPSKKTTSKKRPQKNKEKPKAAKRISLRMGAEAASSKADPDYKSRRW